MPNPGRFYVAILRHLVESRPVPEACELGAWIEAQVWEYKPPDYAKLVDRLKKWPPGQPYPAIPDDDALAHGMRPDPRWWKPGSAGAATAAAQVLALAERLRVTPD